jgi:hypothetical protein
MVMIGVMLMLTLIKQESSLIIWYKKAENKRVYLVQEGGK